MHITCWWTNQNGEWYITNDISHLNTIIWTYQTHMISKFKGRKIVNFNPRIFTDMKATYKFGNLNKSDVKCSITLGYLDQYRCRGLRLWNSRDHEAVEESSLKTMGILTHCGQDKMAANLQTDIFKCIFLNENAPILITISLKFVPTGPINNILSFIKVMARHQPGNKLNQWWSDYQCIYASLGLKELTKLFCTSGPNLEMLTMM